MWRSYKERVHALSKRLVEAQRPIRVLDALKWSDEVEEQFFARKGRDLPKVDAAWYLENRALRLDPDAKIEEFEGIRRDLDAQLGQDDPLGAILHRRDFLPRRISWAFHPGTIYLCPVREQISFGVFTYFWEEIRIYCGRFLGLPGSPQRACPREGASWMVSPYTICLRPLHPGRASGLLI